MGAGDFLVGTNWDKHIQTVDLDVDWKRIHYVLN